MQELLKKIEQRQARIVVIGIGYVGLPLVVEFAKAGFTVTGYDKDPEKVKKLGLGESYIGDIPSSELKPLVAEGKLKASTDPAVLGEADAIIAELRALLARLDDARVDVAALTVHTPDLDDVFLALTGRPAAEEVPA